MPHSIVRNSACLDSMADSDRSRSPVPGRNRSEPRGPVQPVRQELPFFPRWCGPMQAAVWHSQQMSRPQFRPQFNMQQPGAYISNRSTSQTSSVLSGTWPNPRFPPAPPSSPPPTLVYISSSTTPCHSTLLTYLTLSTNSTSLTEHSIRSVISASSTWHSTYDLTRRSHNSGRQSDLWLRSQSSLAR